MKQAAKPLVASRAVAAPRVALITAALLVAACQTDPPDATTAPVTAGTGPVTGAPVVVTEKSFKCLQEMTPVRGFFVDNIAGDLEGTLAVANSAEGGVYPPGSVVQLFPNEVMVKREKGFNPITRDWEFFELDVDENGSTIRRRGFQDVVNRFGGNCFACHVQAKPQFDLICEKENGCAALPISDLAVHSLQNTDPRCEPADVPFTQSVTAWFLKTFTSL